MGLQLRNTNFDPGTPARITELTTIINDAGIVAFTKKLGLASSSNNRAVYEGVGANFILRLEVPAAFQGSLATLDGAITGAGASLLLVTDGWNAGSDRDLRE